MRVSAKNCWTIAVPYMSINKDTSKAPGADEVIDLEEYTKSDKKPPEGKKYRVRIDDERYVFDSQFVKGRHLLEKAGEKPAECHTLYQKLKGCDFERISLDETVDLGKPGIEHFVVKPPEVFHYSVDDEPETTEEKFMTPSGILKSEGLKPEDYYLVQVFPDGTQKSYKDTPDQPIEMQCPGHKFVSVFRGETPVS